MKLALFGTPDGGLLVGEGPFERQTKPPSGEVAFYRNDFALSSDRPWWIPSSVRVLGAGEQPVSGDPDTLAIEWQEPDVDPFADVFGEVSQAIRAGLIEKSVPVATALGRVTAGEPESLLNRLAGAPAPLRAYAWVDDQEGCAGLSPELLFRLSGDRLQTMALAGTARREEHAAFAVDEKEIREHEFVAQTLLAKLADLGEIDRHPRAIMDLGRLVHFHSAIEVILDDAPSLGRLVRVLHPTPALGPLPRTAETMRQLLGWRERLGCPRWFGAPFGLWRDGVFESLVAIRMVSWSGDRLQIPSGCGVIEESRLVNEWRELRLKREAVRAGFGF